MSCPPVEGGGAGSAPSTTGHDSLLPPSTTIAFYRRLPPPTTTAFYRALQRTQHARRPRGVCPGEAYLVGGGGGEGDWMVEKGGGIGDFGGGSLETPSQRLHSRWLGLALGAPSCTGPPGAR